MNKGQAKFLYASSHSRLKNNPNFSDKLKQFTTRTKQNRKTKTNAVHISLNFSNKDCLDKALLSKVAADYMDRIGFGSQPYLVYQHFDAAHPHIHILTTNIKNGGSRIETHNIGKDRSEPARKAIEKEFNLIRAEDQKKDREFLLEPLVSAYYGKTETKKAISNIVREVIRSYHFTSLPELNAILRQFNVTADRGEEGTRMRKKGGLIYSISDVQGNKTSVPVKASSIYSKPTLANLQKKFERNRISTKKFKPRLKKMLDQALTSSTSKKEVEEYLRKKGVKLVFHTNEQGLTYGITIIDNAQRCVFNGSALGKGYAASAILKQLEEVKKQPLHRPDKTDVKSTSQPDMDKSIDLSSAMETPSGGDPIPYALRQKKKKKKKRKSNR